MQRRRTRVIGQSFPNPINGAGHVLRLGNPNEERKVPSRSSAASARYGHRMRFLNRATQAFGMTLHDRTKETFTLQELGDKITQEGSNTYGSRQGQMAVEMVVQLIDKNERYVSFPVVASVQYEPVTGGIDKNDLLRAIAKAMKRNAEVDSGELYLVNSGDADEDIFGNIAGQSVGQLERALSDFGDNRGTKLMVIQHLKIKGKPVPRTAQRSVIAGRPAGRSAFPLRDFTKVDRKTMKVFTTAANRDIQFLCWSKNLSCCDLVIGAINNQLLLSQIVNIEAEESKIKLQVKEGKKTKDLRQDCVGDLYSMEELYDNLKASSTRRHNVLFIDVKQKRCKGLFDRFQFNKEKAPAKGRKRMTKRQEAQAKLQQELFEEDDQDQDTLLQIVQVLQEYLNSIYRVSLGQLQKLYLRIKELLYSKSKQLEIDGEKPSYLQMFHYFEHAYIVCLYDEHVFIMDKNGDRGKGVTMRGTFKEMFRRMNPPHFIKSGTELKRTGNILTSNANFIVKDQYQISLNTPGMRKALQEQKEQDPDGYIPPAQKSTIPPLLCHKLKKRITEFHYIYDLYFKNTNGKLKGLIKILENHLDDIRSIQTLRIAMVPYYPRKVYVGKDEYLFNEHLTMAQCTTEETIAAETAKLQERQKMLEIFIKGCKLMKSNNIKFKRSKQIFHDERIFIDIESEKKLVEGMPGNQRPIILCLSKCSFKSKERKTKKFVKEREDQDLAREFVQYLYKKELKQLSQLHTNRVNSKKIGVKKRKISVIAHNGCGYDFKFLIDPIYDIFKSSQKIIVAKGLQPKQIIVKSELTTIEFIDSMLMLPFSLKQIGETFAGESKMECDVNISSWEECEEETKRNLITYCEQDVKVLEVGLTKFEKNLFKLKIWKSVLKGQKICADIKKKTIAGISLDIFIQSYVHMSECVADPVIVEIMNKLSKRNKWTRVEDEKKELICIENAIFRGNDKQYKYDVVHQLRNFGTEHDEARQFFLLNSLSDERDSYFGGMTQVFKIKNAPEKEVFCYDINSQYPSCMQNPMPVELLRLCAINEFTTREFTQVEELTQELYQMYCSDPEFYQGETTFLMKVAFQFREEEKYPFIPQRIEDGIIYPLQGVAYLWKETIQQLLEVGGRVQAFVEEEDTRPPMVYFYRLGRCFERFVEDFYEQRQQSKRKMKEIKQKLEQGGPELNREKLEKKYRNHQVKEQINKLLLNSLYGKFGQRSFDNRVFGRANDIYELQQIVDQIEERGGHQTEIKSFQIHEGKYFEIVYKQTQFLEKGLHTAALEQIGKSSGQYVRISSYITALARNKLANGIHAAKSMGHEVCYCDTDSMFVEGKIDENHPVYGEIFDDTQIGKWAQEGEGGNIAYFWRPKMYIVGKKHSDTDLAILKGKCKGVRQNAIDFNRMIEDYEDGIFQQVTDSQVQFKRGFTGVMVQDIIKIITTFNTRRKIDNLTIYGLEGQKNIQEFVDEVVATNSQEEMNQKFNDFVERWKLNAYSTTSPFVSTDEYQMSQDSMQLYKGMLQTTIDFEFNKKLDFKEGQKRIQQIQSWLRSRVQTYNSSERRNRCMTNDAAKEHERMINTNNKILKQIGNTVISLAKNVDTLDTNMSVYDYVLFMDDLKARLSQRYAYPLLNSFRYFDELISTQKRLDASFTDITAMQQTQHRPHRKSDRERLNEVLQKVKNEIEDRVQSIFRDSIKERNYQLVVQRGCGSIDTPLTPKVHIFPQIILLLDETADEDESNKRFWQNVQLLHFLAGKSVSSFFEDGLSVEEVQRIFTEARDLIERGCVYKLVKGFTLLMKNMNDDYWKYQQMLKEMMINLQEREKLIMLLCEVMNGKLKFKPTGDSYIVEIVYKDEPTSLTNDDLAHQVMGEFYAEDEFADEGDFGVPSEHSGESMEKVLSSMADEYGMDNDEEDSYVPVPDDFDEIQERHADECNEGDDEGFDADEVLPDESIDAEFISVDEADEDDEDDDETSEFHQSGPNKRQHIVDDQ